MTFLCLYISRWWCQPWYTPLYFTVVNQSDARISTEHGINYMILHTTLQWQRQNLNQELAFLKDSLYLTLMGELWGVYCDDFGENWLRYNGTALYFNWCYLMGFSWPCSAVVLMRCTPKGDKNITVIDAWSIWWLLMIWQCKELGHYNATTLYDIQHDSQGCF